MITELSPALKRHIEAYIEEIEQNRVNESIIMCPLDILDDYIKVLKQIDITPHVGLQTYIDIATCIASKIEHATCLTVRVLGSNSASYEFRCPLQNIDWKQFNQELQRWCPYEYISSSITYDYGLSCTHIHVSVQPLGTFRF